MPKNWLTFLNALRPATRRQQRAGRHAAPRHSAEPAPTYHEPYDARMSDRFRPVLSTR